MTYTISSSFNESQPDSDLAQPDGNLALTDPSIPCDGLFDPIKPLPLELIREIMKSNPAALSRVSSRLRDISQDKDLSKEIFNGFSEHMQKAIHEMNKLSPEPQLPLTAPRLQILAYSKLSQELKDIRLDPAAIKFTQDDLASYRVADRLIEAKNFCLFCSTIPGITVNKEILDSKEGILVQNNLCLQQFNRLNLTAIKSLNLQNLGLTRLPTEIGQLTALDTLLLGNNRLTALPESFGNLTDLQWLLLGNNRLTALPESFRNLAGLQTLALYNNRLTALPEYFENLAALRTLHLQNNLLTALPNTLCDLHLQTISFDGNPLTFFQKQRFNYHFKRKVFQRDALVVAAITAVVGCAVARLCISSAS